MYGCFDELTKPHKWSIINGKRNGGVAMSQKSNENPIKMEILRKEQGISRQELSRRSGVPIRTLEGWSSRARIPRDVYQLLKVAKVLGCHIEDLIEPELAEKSTPEETPSDK